MNVENRTAPSGRSLGSKEPRPCATVVTGGDAGRWGLAEIVEQLSRRGVPGFEIELIAADRGRSVTILEQTLTARRPALVHICSAGSVGTDALALAGARGIPACASHHGADLTADAASLYRACSVVLSPSRHADASLRDAGVDPERVHRWERGVDFDCFSPARYHPDAIPSAGTGGARVTVLYAGRLIEGKGLDLLADAFLLAHEHDPRLRLVLAGDGPIEPSLRRRLGDRALFLGRLDRDALAGVYASADLLVFPASRESTGQVILEAQASGLPVLAVDGGGGAELVESGRSGCLVDPSASALAAAIYGLARRPPLRERLVTGGLAAVRGRTWEHALQQLSDAWSAALGAGAVLPASASVPEAAYAA